MISSVVSTPTMIVESPKMRRKTMSAAEKKQVDIWDVTAQTFANLHCPFEAKKNLAVTQAEDKSKAWAEEIGLLTSEQVKKFYALGFTHLMAYVHPFSVQKLLTLYTDWVTMIFCYDDLVEKKLCKEPKHLKEFNNKIMAILKGSENAVEDKKFSNAESAIIKAVQNLRDRFKEFSNTEWQNRLIYEMQLYLDATIWESTKKGATLADYLKWRPLTGAQYVMFTMIELDQKIEISKKLFKNTLFKKIRKLCNEIIYLANDIISYPKEDKESGNNIIHIFTAKPHNLSFEEAVKRVEEMHNEKIKLLQDLVKDIKKPSEFLSYIEGMLIWIAGYKAWAPTSLRYQKPKPELTWKKA